ncbi:MAG: HpcH/HpaI aldolase/citrate lyase family protein [Pseudomonadota bacterium]
MPPPLNKFKKSLKAGETQIGCWIGLADSYPMEISGTAGFDWLLIDGEHAPNDLRSMLQQLQAMQASDSEAIIRLPVGEAWMIKQALDIGAQTLLIPMVESKEQAKDLVRATRYPPQGYRGVGSALARASKFAGIPDYVTTANDEICLLVQVESRAGIDALDDILSVDGVDGVFIGPADLAADMGFPGNAKDPAVMGTIEKALAKICEAGKAAGILATYDEFIQDSLKWGATFVAVGVDVTLFAGIMRSLANRYTSG